MSEASMFLTESEVDELTGIARGRTVKIGKHDVKRDKYELQVAHLRTTGLPFYQNVRGRPIIARVAVEGRNSSAESPRRPAWQPSVITSH